MWKKSFPLLEETSGKQVFQPCKKLIMSGFLKSKPTFAAYLLATFDHGNLNLTFVFLIYRLIYFPFSDKNKIEK